MNLFEEQQHEFASRHIGTNNEHNTTEMLKVIGVQSVEELISKTVPQSIRLKKSLKLPVRLFPERKYSDYFRQVFLVHIYIHLHRQSAADTEFFP